MRKLHFYAVSLQFAWMAPSDDKTERSQCTQLLFATKQTEHISIFTCSEGLKC